ncbi:MAG: DUF1801 domain-containing protein [Bacteroidia bacterium]
MAKKGPMPNFETMDDYISHQGEVQQKLLRELRQIVKEAAPDAEERLFYKVPSFSLVPNGKLEHQIMMAAYSKFVSFYPFTTTMAKFSERLKEYKQGEGTVQFPLDKPLPKAIISEMVKFRRDELMKES